MRQALGPGALGRPRAILQNANFKENFLIRKRKMYFGNGTNEKS